MNTLIKLIKCVYLMILLRFFIAKRAKCFYDIKNTKSNTYKPQECSNNSKYLIVHYQSFNSSKYLKSFLETNKIAKNIMIIPKVVKSICGTFKDSIFTIKNANILNIAVKKAKSNVLNKSISFSSLLLFIPYYILIPNQMEVNNENF